MTVNIGYAWGQWMRARHAASQHPDGELRAHALEAVAKWERVIEGMRAGRLDVGSRTPTRAPAWVTLDVVTGGFATGGYAAGGPLHAHERALAGRLVVAETRVALNLHYLVSDDAAELLASACYRIDVPEEGALLVVAWLRARGEGARAAELVDVIAPWFEELRFYPAAADRPVELREAVRLQDLGATVRGIATERRQPRVETMRDALAVWKPLRDRAIALFAETIAGDLPRLAGRGIAGGAPGAAPPDGWRPRVAQLVADRARAGSATTTRARDAALWIERLERYARDPRTLTPAEVQHVRWAIARQATRGLYGTPAAEARRADQLRAVAAPLHADLRRVLVARLRALPQDGGVELERALAPVTAEEAAAFGVPEGSALPDYLTPKVARSGDASLAELVERGVIGSAEVFARVLPQVTAQVRAQPLDDEAGRRLYTALYTAFRRRRGLLLMNYQHQVLFCELPWVAALEAARVPSSDAAARARDVVASTSGVALRAFPYTVLPNKLVGELRALAQAADLQLPLVEELAADIFMGGFTAKFVAAAQVAARRIAGTLYQRYYGIDVDELARLPMPDQTSAEFAAICVRRAGAIGRASGIAGNGTIIEQAQILTTHNLAALFDALPLCDQLAAQLRSIAETCMNWMLARLRLRTPSWHQTLVNLKNAAYAWQQMMFYASFATDAVDFARWVRDRLAWTARVDGDLVRRFEPAIRGLELAASGVASADPAFAAGGGRVFTGWSTDRHWLIGGALPR